MPEGLGFPAMTRATRDISFSRPVLFRLLAAAGARFPEIDRGIVLLR